MANLTKHIGDNLDSTFERLLATGGTDVKILFIRDDNVADQAQLQMIAESDRWSDAGLERVERGEYGAAISLFWMSLAHERIIGSPFRLANDYGNLGLAYLSLGHPKEARAALDESLRLYSTANSAAGAAKTYYALAQWEILEKSWPRAYEFARRSLLLFEKHQHRSAKSARELLEWIGARLSAE